MWLNCQKHAIYASQLWQNSPLDCHPNHLTSETEKCIFGAKIQISFKISHTVICRDWWTGMMGTTSGTCSRGMPTRIASQFDDWNFKCLHNIFRNTNCWKETIWVNQKKMENWKIAKKIDKIEKLDKIENWTRLKSWTNWKGGQNWEIESWTKLKSLTKLKLDKIEKIVDLQHWFPITKFVRQLMLLHKIFLQVCFHWLWIACLGRCHVSLEAAAQYYWWWKLSKINVTLL